MLVDGLQRRISYLRVSVTDRCDFRCRYCMAGDVTFVPRADVLTHAEMERLCAAFIRQGVRKLRITGGEPLVRRDILDLLRPLGGHLGSGLDELTLTTNGSQLARYAADLVTVGVRRINVSLDTLDVAKFGEITRTGRLAQVLDGLKAAREAGLAVKINAVAMAGINDDEFIGLAEWCAAQGFNLTFIETMPFGEGVAGDNRFFIPIAEVRRRLETRWSLVPHAGSSGGPARYWQVSELGINIGFISALSDHFCDSCNRVRLDCKGKLHLCLADTDSVDLRALIRAGATDADLDAAIAKAILTKPSGHGWLTMDGSNSLPRTLNTLGG